MGARSDFRHYAAVRLMKRNLSVDYIRQNRATVLDDGGSGLVTACFYTENVHYQNFHQGRSTGLMPPSRL